MKPAILGTLALLAIIAAPALTHAATYEYVSVAGTLETVTAATAEEALLIPTDIAAHSGVILLANAPVTSTMTTTTVPPTTTVVTTSMPSVTTTSTNSLPLSAVGTYTSSSTANVVGIDNTTPAGTSAESYSTLVLNQNGTATITTNYTNGEASMVQNGNWEMITPTSGYTGTNEVQLTLVGTGNTVYSPEQVIVFDQNGTTLTASSYPTGMYPGGLVFTMENSSTQTMYPTNSMATTTMTTY